MPVIFLSDQSLTARVEAWIAALFNLWRLKNVYRLAQTVRMGLPATDTAMVILMAIT